MTSDLLACPECRSPMVEEDHHGVTLDRCGDCGGLWFDLEEIHAYLKAHPSVPASDKPMEADFSRHTSGVGAPCTCCGENAVELGDYRGIAFQRCTWCGGIFVGRRQIREIVAARAGQVTTWGPAGEFSAAAAAAGGAVATSAGVDPSTRSLGEQVGEGAIDIAEGGFEVAAEAALDGGGELLGAALELVLEFVIGAIGAALGG